jgi:hypothetical protein
LVLFHFVRPELSIRRGDGVVFRTSVPEAAVEEHGNLCFSENQIGGSAQIREGA